MPPTHTRIGGVDLGTEPLLLAPMEDVSDSAFRLLCRQFGAAMVYSEFISADALIRQVRGSLNKMHLDAGERPAVIQLYGRDVATMVEAAKIAAEARPELIDLNFGCPVKRVAGKGAGSGMLRNIPLLLDITRSVVKASPVPVSVKTRLGWDHSNLIIEELAESLQDCGIAALTIHGRTRSDMYQGKADWRLIGKVKENPRISIPIIGNGDITSGQEAREAFNRYGVDAIMIGRASIGRPWIFGEVKAYLEATGKGETPPPETPESFLSYPQQLEVLKQMIRNNIAKLDERRGILHSRRHIATTPLLKGIPNFREMRIALLRATTLEELLALLDESTPMILGERVSAPITA